jgi:hypothetical protein
MREKSGVSKGSALVFANGLEAGRVAEALAERLCVAAAVGAAETTANAAVARRIVRIISLPEVE